MCYIALETHSNTLGGATGGRRLNKVTQQRFHFPLKNHKILLRKSQNLTKISKHSKTWKLRRHIELFTQKQRRCAIRAISGAGPALSPHSVGDGLDWRRHNEDDGEWHFQHNIYWTVTRVLNWTVEERQRTDGRVFSSPRSPVGDRRDEAAPLTLHYGDWLAIYKTEN